ncbi:transglutaminase family protein [Labrenzia sp. VG12]|uniref:transglutaminase-like domain-containing protein n=1 Tax=Labrenzia sp. VG12 TaxID=2021862 RepID=UPI00352CA2A6
MRTVASVGKRPISPTTWPGTSEPGPTRPNNPKNCPGALRAGARLFPNTPGNELGRFWGVNVQTICDFVHNHVRFGHENSRSTRTAAETLNEGVGVCRDYAHLASTLCRSLNIPARYCA